VYRDRAAHNYCTGSAVGQRVQYEEQHKPCASCCAAKGAKQTGEMNMSDQNQKL